MPTPISAQTPALAPRAPARQPPAEQPFVGASETEEIDSGNIEFRDLWQNKGKGLTFGDLVDILNPLQHIPVISTIYREMTGDQVGLGTRLVGGALYGGPVGLALGVAQAASEQATGKDIGANMVAFLKESTGFGAPDPAANIAQAGPADSTPARRRARSAAAATRTAAPHPYALPANASPQWLSNAMERALSKYEDTLRQRPVAR
jgi:hypothetical protein